MTSPMTRRQHLATLMAGAALATGLRSARAQTVPWSSGTERPTIMVPPGATDCHHHVYDARFPAAPGATLRPPDASVSDYRLLMQRLGLTRHVVVQPSTYGVDNSLLVQSVKDFGPTARGIVMLDATVTAEELKRLDAAGIRGVRFGTRLPGGAAMADMVPVARKIADLGWHIQLVSDGDKIVALADTLKGLPVPVVFDHMGHLPEPAGPDHPGFRVIAELIDKHGAWVKLTGAYLLSTVGPPTYADRSRLARAYVQLAPERLVWGSDWPHPTSPTDAKPDDAVLLDLLANWAPEDAVRNRILVTNPANLYGF